MEIPLLYKCMYILCLIEANKLLKPTSYTRLAFKMKDHYGQWRLKIHDFRYAQERGFHKGVYTLIVLIIKMSFSVFSSKGKPKTTMCCFISLLTWCFRNLFQVHASDPATVYHA